MNDSVRRLLREYINAQENFHMNRVAPLFLEIKRWVELEESRCSETSTSGSLTA